MPSFINTHIKLNTSYALSQFITLNSMEAESLALCFVSVPDPRAVHPITLQLRGIECLKKKKKNTQLLKVAYQNSKDYFVCSHRTLSNKNMKQC